MHWMRDSRRKPCYGQWQSLQTAKLHKVAKLHGACQAPKPVALSAAPLVIAQMEWSTVNCSRHCDRLDLPVAGEHLPRIDACLGAYRTISGFKATATVYALIPGLHLVTTNRKLVRNFTRAQDAMTVRLGVDVGGTNTDGVVLHGSKVIGASKHSTSNDVVSSVQMAITAALQTCSRGSRQEVVCVSSDLTI